MDFGCRLGQHGDNNSNACHISNTMDISLPPGPLKLDESSNAKIPQSPLYYSSGVLHCATSRVTQETRVWQSPPSLHSETGFEST